MIYVRHAKPFVSHGEMSRFVLAAFGVVEASGETFRRQAPNPFRPVKASNYLKINVKYSVKLHNGANSTDVILRCEVKLRVSKMVQFVTTSRLLKRLSRPLRGALGRGLSVTKK